MDLQVIVEAEPGGVPMMTSPLLGIATDCPDRRRPLNGRMWLVNECDECV